MKLRATQSLEGKHPIHADYPLLPGDILTRSSDGTFAKHAPGIGVFGFVLTEQDIATLEEAPEARWTIS